MVEIFRSITWGDASETKQATENLTKVRKDRLLELGAKEQQVLDFVLDFYVKYTQAPNLSSLKDFAEDLKDPNITSIVEDVELTKFHYGADFEELFEREVKQQGLSAMVVVCKEAIALVNTGKKSLEDAVGHLFTTIRVPPSKTSDRLPANMKKASGFLDALYHKRKVAPQNSFGIMTGYGAIDQATAGVRKKQLYLHAAFPGHLKSTMAMNMMVNAAVDYGWNQILFTAEMPADDVMLRLICIHSAHKKFNGIHRPLSAFKLMMGKLSDPEETFFKEVKDDLINNKDHGSIRVVDSSEFTTLGSIMQRITRENQEQEVDEAWLDYLTRLPVDAKYQKMKLSLTEARNESIVEAKQFAMGFNGGTGIAICSLFQTNRDSFKRAKESDPPGKMDKTCLAQFNAAEKEADVITYTWYDDEEKRLSEPKLGFLKSRWGEDTSDLISLFIERDSRRIFDMTSGLRVSSTPTQAAGGATTDVEL